MRKIAVASLMLFTLSAGVYAQRSSPEVRWQAWSKHQELSEASLLHGISWRSIGPAVQGGRVVDVEAVPGQPYSFYVAYASGGIWKTTNNGGSFAPLSDALASMISGDIAVDPQDPQTLWVGTGEPNASRSSYSGLGVYLSRDGGKSFTHKGLTGADRISRIVVDPRNSKRIFVAVQGALYSSGGMRGIYRSDDAGDTWQQVLAGANGWTGANELLLHPSDPQVMYASLWERSRSPWEFVESGKGSGVYKSTDGGTTWAAMPGFPQGDNIGRIGLAVSKAEPNWLYASVDNHAELPAEQLQASDGPLSPARLKTMTKEAFLALDPEQIELFIRGSDLPVELTATGLIAKIKSGELTIEQLRARLRDGNAALFNTDIRGLQVYRSEDAGATWKLRNSAPIRDFTYTYGYYFATIQVAPDDANKVTILGVPLGQSLDGGESFDGSLNDPNVHVDHHVWWVDPNSPERILNGNDGGLDASFDGGKTFLKVDRQAVGQSYAVAYDFAEPYNVYTGLQDNGTYRGSSQAKPDDLDAWSFVSGGDGMQIQVDPRDNKTVYSGYQFGFYRRGGEDAGETRPRPGLTEANLRFNWQTPILLSTHNSDVLYIGAQRLFRSLDQGRTFSPISADLTRSKQRGNVPFATVTSIAESAKNFGVLIAGTDDGQLWVSEDSGAQWRDVGTDLPDTWVSRVQLSQHASKRAYVAFNAYRQDDMRALVYVSENLGRNWKSIAQGLPDEPINALIEDPINPDLLYVGSDRGVYVSLDRGVNWQALDQDLPNVPVHDLAVHPRARELIAGTHGRSVWIADVLPIQELTAKVRDSAVHGFFVGEQTFDRDWKSRRSAWFDRPQDRPKLTLNYWAKKAGSGVLEIRAKNASVLREIKLEAKPGINKVDWDLLVDAEQALKFEQASLAERVELGKLKTPYSASETPYANAREYDWPQYLQPGSYRAVYRLAGATHQVKFKMKAPEALKPRIKEPAKVRGK